MARCPCRWISEITMPKTLNTYHSSIELIPKIPKKSKAYWQLRHWGNQWDNRTLTIHISSKKKKKNFVCTRLIGVVNPYRMCHKYTAKFGADDNLSGLGAWQPCICTDVCVCECCYHDPETNWIRVQDRTFRPRTNPDFGLGSNCLGPGPNCTWARNQVPYGSKCINAIAPQSER